MILSPTRRREAYLIIGIAALYLFLWLLLPKPAFWGVDNGFKFQGMKAFAETGRIVVPDAGIELGITPKYRSIQLPFGVAVANGQIPVFSPLFMILGGLLILLFGQTGPFLLPLVGGWGVLLASWSLWIRQRESHDGTVFILMIGLCSPILFYSLTLWEHTLAAAALTYALAMLCAPRNDKFDRDSTTGVFPAGLLVGLAAILRTEAALWAVIIIFFWNSTGRSTRTRSAFIFGFLAAIIAGIAINLWQTSVPYPLHIFSNLTVRPPGSLMQLAITRARNVYLILFQGFSSNILSILGLIPLGMVILWLKWRYEKGWWPFVGGGVILAAGFYIYTIVSNGNVVANTAESGGLLWIMPIAVLFLLPLRGERRKFWSFIWTGSMLFIVLLAAFSPVIKGIHWGPRLLTVILPFLMLFISVRLQRWWSRHPQTRFVLVVLLVFSFVNQSISYYLDYRAKSLNREVNSWVVDNCSGIILTKNWWLPGDCSLNSYNQPWFVVRNGESYSKIMRILKTKNIDEVHFVETPPYLGEGLMKQMGITETDADYFKRGNIELKRSRLSLNPLVQFP